MNVGAALEAMPGYDATLETTSTVLGPTQRVEFHSGARQERPEVTAYFGEAEGLFCVVPDACRGPLVHLDGLQLNGRDPSQWEDEFVEYVASRGVGLYYSPAGYAGSDDFGLVMQVQPDADALITRPVLIVVRERACTLWDSMPHEEITLYR
ncbi:hypothetical protein [Catenulispora rubra]|uniref:hypothetical protein n=1 Tax=Catenulispora rubra TaxID=280293 RepID=UPI00189272D6|nr:hypothetical protein [Catenulispora rubra]